MSEGSKLPRPPPPQPASAPESATRTAAAIRRCGRRMVVFPLNSFSVSSLQPAEAGPAVLRRASACSAASGRHWRSYPAIAAPRRYRWRARPTGPAIRARYGERSLPVQQRLRGAPSCWDSWCSSSSNCAARIRARSCSAAPTLRSAAISSNILAAACGSRRSYFRRQTQPRQHAVSERRFRHQIGEGRFGLGVLVGV